MKKTKRLPMMGETEDMERVESEETTQKEAKGGDYSMGSEGKRNNADLGLSYGGE